MEDLSTAEEPRATVVTRREESKPNLGMDEEFPGCIVEEFSWQAIEAELKMDNTRSVRKDVGDGAKQREFNNAGGGLHGFLLRAEHLSLVFELRGHMSDLEHRALIMSQRLDMLLDAYSGAPAWRRCPLYAQSFAIPTGSTWKTNEGDRSPIT